VKHSVFLIFVALAGFIGCDDDTADAPAGTAGAGAGGVAGSTQPPAGGLGGTGGGAGSAGMMSAMGGSGAAGAGGAGVGGAAAAGAGGMAGMAGAGGSAGPTGAPTFTAIYKEIFTVGAVGNCMFAACHGAPPDPALNGALTIMVGMQQEAYMNLVNVTSTGTKCGMGRKLVIPGDSANSLLIQKFSDTPPCGDKMPIGRPLTAAQVKQIADWIDMGAMNN
jgi:hypothetical protein